MELKKLLEPFMFAWRTPYAWLNRARSLGFSKTIGFLFPDVPEEMIHAYGVLPVSVSGIPGNVKYAYGYLPSFSCAPNVGPFESALSGELGPINGLIIPYACDATRALSQVWEATFPDHFTHALWLPKKSGGTAPKAFFKQELLRMKDALSHFTGRCISDQDIRESIKIYNQHRNLLRTLNGYRLENPSLLSNTDFMAIVKSSMTMPKKEHTEQVVQLLEALKEFGTGQESSPNESIRIFVFGMICENRAIFQCLDKADLTIAEDNLCNGFRYFDDDVKESGDPVDNLVARHFKRDPMGCYQYSREDWHRYITDKVRKNRIDGVVYMIPKHCEVVRFDYPMIKEVLEENDVPLILIETDDLSGSVGQIETRIEAFAEMLRGRKSEII